jgi:hypothetical protein
MRYQRADVKGGTYFFTVNLAERGRRLLVDHIDVLRASVKNVKHRHPFHIDAFVARPFLLAVSPVPGERHHSATIALPIKCRQITTLSSTSDDERSLHEKSDAPQTGKYSQSLGDKRLSRLRSVVS